MKKKEYAPPRMKTMTYREIVDAMGPAIAGVYGPDGGPFDT